MTLLQSSLHSFPLRCVLDQASLDLDSYVRTRLDLPYVTLISDYGLIPEAIGPLPLGPAL